MTRARLRRGDFFCAAVLAFLTLGVFAPAIRFEFIGFDDHGYVLDNPHVRSGLTADSIAWAMTTPAQSNWHPLTWLSLQLDVSLFGASAAAMHAHNVLLHAGSSGLLLLALVKLTGRRLPSIVTAALFAWHPLHVESVAWISERKDVLAGFYMMLCLLTYGFYVDRPRWRTYALLCVLLSLGLMAKPMLVTLPAVLMVLDYWPLGRNRIDRLLPTRPYFRATLTALIVEKFPLLLLVATSSIITYIVQNAGNSVVSVHSTPLPARLENAAVSYATYLSKTIWPSGLAIFYPMFKTYPGGSLSGAALTISVAALLILSAIAWMTRQRAPWIAAGWCWYLGMLVPVIGIVQVGQQAWADRYSYTPLIGIFFAFSWTVFAIRPRIGMAVFSVLLPASVAVTEHQLQFWRDTPAMMRHAIAAVPDNYEAHAMLGRALDDQGLTSQAEEEYREARRILPGEANATYNLAILEQKRNNIDAAIRLYYEELKSDPNYIAAYNNLGNLLADGGRRDEALRVYQAGLEHDSEGAPQLAHNYALAFADANRLAEALPLWKRALKLDPGYIDARFCYGQALLVLGQREQGIAELIDARRRAPNRRDIVEALEKATAH